MSLFGTIVYGVKTPIIKNGDDLVEIVTSSVLNACNENNVELQDKDVVAVKEAVVGISQGNFATVEQITKDVESKFKGKTVGLIFPIFSRNRFSLILSAIAKGVKKLVIMLSYPSDEVGNSLMEDKKFLDSGVNPYGEALTESQYRKVFGETKHIFTGVDYVELYKSIAGSNTEIIFSNKPEEILKYTKYVINADIHTRKQTKTFLLKAGAEKVVSLDEILNKSVDGSGFNPDYGILGSNLVKDDTLKLFPRDADKLVEKLQKKFMELTGKKIECMIYGDGAFKDPVGKIWELADPVVSPGYTSGLIGVPNELKLKYISENILANLRGEELNKAMKKLIKEKSKDLKNQKTSLGTTPRQITDLIGSLCDLTTGSGDKGTPVVLVQNYFKNYAD
ncbi:MAG: coenzyme F420-0:L-glutamate ligase [Clostridia bacterium]|nr:coenzyme F420-0:L-glutamate ligase [Clostridia bacterium]